MTLQSGPTKNGCKYIYTRTGPTLSTMVPLQRTSPQASIRSTKARVGESVTPPHPRQPPTDTSTYFFSGLTAGRGLRPPAAPPPVVASRTELVAANNAWYCVCGVQTCKRAVSWRVLVWVAVCARATQRCTQLGNEHTAAICWPPCAHLFVCESCRDFGGCGFRRELQKRLDAGRQGSEARTARCGVRECIQNGPSLLAARMPLLKILVGGKHKIFARQW